MVLAEVRQAFVEATGYRGLVTDAPAGDYTDKAGLLMNGTYFINRGCEWLDRRWPGNGSELRYRGNLFIGGNKIEVPHLQFVRRLDISDGTTVSHPRMVSYDDLRAMYTIPFDDVDNGVPVYWAWNPRAHVSLTGSIVNGGFSSGLAGWTIPSDSGGAVTVSNGKLNLADTTGANPALLQRLPTFYPQEQEVTITVDTIPNGSFLLTFARYNDDINGYEPTHFESITTAGTYTYDGGSGGDWDTIALIYGSTGASTCIVDDVILVGGETETSTASFQKQIIFMPPAASDYSVDIWGAFANTPLAAEDSFNWWTLEHPDLVIDAARAIYERQGHRNVSGAKVFEENCERELSRLWSEYRYAFYSGMNPQDYALNG